MLLLYLKLCQEILRCRGEAPEITKIEDFIERSEIREVLEMSAEKVFQSWNQWQKQSDGKKMSWQSSQVRFKLPNATVGKDYKALIEIESMGNLEVIRIDGLDELGFRYIETQKRVQGSPSKAGEYPLSVHYYFPDSQYKKTAQQQTLNLVINNDPKTLWKNIPSDPNMKFWKPDEDKQEKDGQDGWKLVHESGNHNTTLRRSMAFQKMSNERG